MYHTNCYIQTMQVFYCRYFWKPEALVYFISLCDENYYIQQMQLFLCIYC